MGQHLPLVRRASSRYQEVVVGDFYAMLNRDRARWALASLLSIAILSAPAVWNRFPLLQWDTGGYIARWYEHSLVISRSTVYGLFLNAGSALAFWPVVAVQSALTVWVMALTLRAVGSRNRPWLLTGIIAVLSVLTTLPWLTSILLTAFSAATHSATIAVLGGLLIVAAVYARFDRRHLPPRRLTSGAIALALG